MSTNYENRHCRPSLINQIKALLDKDSELKNRFMDQLDKRIKELVKCDFNSYHKDSHHLIYETLLLNTAIKHELGKGEELVVH